MNDNSKWYKQENLEFKQEDMGDIDLTSTQVKSNSENFHFNTALLFEQCVITSFAATDLVIGNSIVFKDCTIGSLSCHATYFWGGLKMINCEVKGFSTFDCAGHNKTPKEFIIDHCTFHSYVDFFDVYFEGPVQITNNDFRAGTNIQSYLTAPYGIEKGIPFMITHNMGVLDLAQKP